MIAIFFLFLTLLGKRIALERLRAASDSLRTEVETREMGLATTSDPGGEA
jgi:hypothetical protein